MNLRKKTTHGISQENSLKKALGFQGGASKSKPFGKQGRTEKLQGRLKRALSNYARKKEIAGSQASGALKLKERVKKIEGKIGAHERAKMRPAGKKADPKTIFLREKVEKGEQAYKKAGEKVLRARGTERREKLKGRHERAFERYLKAQEDLKKRLEAKGIKQSTQPIQSEQPTKQEQSTPSSSTSSQVHSIHYSMASKTPFGQNKVTTYKQMQTDSLNVVYKAKIKDDGSGIVKNEIDEREDKAIQKFYKSVMRVTETDLTACSMVKREVLTSEISKLIGAEKYFPETVFKKLPDKEGLSSCQFFVDGFKQFYKIYYDDVIKGCKKVQNQIMDVNVLDDLFGACDRHGGNIGFDNNGNIVLIDNGYGFARSPGNAWNGAFRTKASGDYDINIKVFDMDDREIVGSINYRRARQKYSKLLLSNKKTINQLFESHGLPKKERESFWLRVNAKPEEYLTNGWNVGGSK